MRPATPGYVHSRDAARSSISITCAALISETSRIRGARIRRKHRRKGRLNGACSTGCHVSRQKCKNGKLRGKERWISGNRAKRSRVEGFWRGRELRADVCYREDCAPRCERVRTEFIPLPCRVHAHPHPSFHPLPRSWIPVQLPNRIPAERIKIIFTHSRFTPRYISFSIFSL